MNKITNYDGIFIITQWLFYENIGKTDPDLNFVLGAFSLSIVEALLATNLVSDQLWSRQPLWHLDCKTVPIFAYSSKREQSNERSGTRLKTESETGERRYGRVRLARLARVRLLRHVLQISLLILRKKPTVLQSMWNTVWAVSDLNFVMKSSPKRPLP